MEKMEKLEKVLELLDKGLKTGDVYCHPFEFSEAYKLLKTTIQEKEGQK